MESNKCKSLAISAPEFFADPQFNAWLNNDDGSPRATWHKKGPCTEYSDTFVLVDPSLNGEGSDSDMPEHIWSEIILACKQHFAPSSKHESHIVVWLKNC